MQANRYKHIPINKVQLPSGVTGISENQVGSQKVKTIVAFRGKKIQVLLLLSRKFFYHPYQLVQKSYNGNTDGTSVRTYMLAVGMSLKYHLSLAYDI